MERDTTSRQTRWRPFFLAAFGWLFCLIGSGCTSPVRTFEPEQSPDALDDVAFVHYLATVPVVTVDEGFRAVLLVAGTAPAPKTFAARRAAIERLGAVKARWRLSPGQVLDKGTLAYMLRSVCGLRRGLNEWIAQLTGLGQRRYAVRACVEAGLLTYGPPNFPVSGGEMLGAVTRATAYLDRRP